MSNKREFYTKRLKDIREARNYSQEQMAEFMKITQSAYARFELGKIKTDLEILERFCSVVEMDIVDFFLYPKKLKDFQKEAVAEKVSITFEISPDKREHLLRMVTGGKE